MLYNRVLMCPDPEDDMTRLFARLSTGDNSAASELIPQVYAELRKLAVAHLRHERSNHTLQATALVHEVYLRLAGRYADDWQGRAHFFALAAHIMRCILVDHARQRRAAKRDGGVAVPFEDVVVISDDRCELVLHVNDALCRLERRDPRQARVVELRYFAGLTEEEIGILLGISTRTVKRDWVVAKAWLKAELYPVEAY